MSRALAAGLAALWLAGCAGLQPAAPVAPEPPKTARNDATLSLDGAEHRAEWHVPAVQPVGLITLQHGFSRSCRHLRGTAAALAGAGLLVLCVDASMAGGNAALARRLAQALAEGEITAPQPVRALPDRVVVSGHSAGAHFAVVLGAELARRAPQRVTGAVLLDPVAGRGFADAALSLSDAGLRPVLSVAAALHPCNARHNAHPALRRVAEAAAAAGRSDFLGVVQEEASTHMDAEGEDTDLLAWAACGRQWPDAQHVATLRALTVHWAVDLAAGRSPAAEGPAAGPLPQAMQQGRMRVLR